MNIANLFVRNSRRHADRPALALGSDVILSHRQLVQRSAAIAGKLRQSLGLRPADRVALIMRNVPEYIELLLAGWYAGLTVVPINSKLHAREFEYILRHAGAKLCFVTPDLIDTVGAIDGLERIIEIGSPEYEALRTGDPVPMTAVDPDDVAWLFYTSGTTGRPKGAMLTHRNLLAMTLSYFADVDQIGPEDAIVHAAPMSHGSGCYILPHAAQGAVQVVPASAGFDPAEIFDLCKAHRGVTLFGAPTMVKRLAEHPAAGADHPGLKTIVYGGGPMYLADLDQAHQAFGHRFAQIYGQGESPMCITALDKACHADTAHPRYRERLASVGTAQTVVEVQVVGENDRPLAPGEIGEVIVRGDSVMRGYWQDAEATAKTLQGGWLHTGDVGALDEDGFLTLRDRSKDLIISGGANIYPREIEDVLFEHPAVADAAVIGVPDERWGEAVRAVVVLRSGESLADDELMDFCRGRIADYKRPRSVTFLDELPRNPSGKVLKRELRDEAGSGEDRRVGGS